MSQLARGRARSLVVLATASALGLSGLLTAVSSQAAAAPTITFADPGTLQAGPVQLSGNVSTGSATQTTSVLYVVDVSRSTEAPATPLDCNGDGTAGNLADNLNGDRLTGDTLDCEIEAVRKLNASLATSPGALQVGLEAFANLADTADMSGAATFIAPGAVDGSGQSRVAVVAQSLVRGKIRQYTEKLVNTVGDPIGTNLDLAATTAVDRLLAAGAGPKYVMFLSDGSQVVSTDTLTKVKNSGVKFRTFALGDKATTACDAGKSLRRLADAGGESCTPVTDPTKLGAQLTGSQPPSITGVFVTIGGKTFTANVDAVGGWRAGVSLGKGTYQATATATLSSGSQVSATRTLTVTDAPGTPGAPTPPPPGGVVGLPGTTQVPTTTVTQVWVRRPGPTRSTFPAYVTGSVGLTGKTLVPTPRLNGATVLLQSRTTLRSSWVTRARSTVASGGYTLHWKRKPVRQIRVVLLSHDGLKASAATVPVPQINSCRTRYRGSRWTVTCHTIAKNGTRARLVKNHKLVGRSKVSHGLVSVTGRGSLRRYVLVLDVTRTHLPTLHWGLRL